MIRTGFSSVQFSYSVVSNSLWPHEWQHARPPYPLPTPGVYSNSCPSNWCCNPVISSSVIPFSSCPQSLPALGSFPMSQHFAWGGQSIRVSASASVLPMNTQDWSPLGRTGWISLQSGDSQESSPTPQFKSINSSVLSFLHSPTLTSIHDHWKNYSLEKLLPWLDGPLLAKPCLCFLDRVRQGQIISAQLGIIRIIRRLHTHILGSWCGQSTGPLIRTPTRRCWVPMVGIVFFFFFLGGGGHYLLSPSLESHALLHLSHAIH